MRYILLNYCVRTILSLIVNELSEGQSMLLRYSLVGSSCKHANDPSDPMKRKIS